MLSTFRTTYACKVFVSSSCVVFVVLVGAVLLLQLRDRFELLSFEPRGRGFFSFFFFFVESFRSVAYVCGTRCDLSRSLVEAVAFHSLNNTEHEHSHANL